MMGRIRLGSALLAVAWAAAATTTSAGCGPDGSSPGHDAAVADASEPDDDGGDDVADAAPADANVDAGPSTDFFTSFEPDEPALTWENTVETDPSGAKLISGISGVPNTAILGNIMEHVTQITASGENPPGEIAAAIGDGDLTSKWLVFANTGWVQFKLDQAIAVKRYAVSSANDAPERDPVNWNLEGSQDGSSWTAINTQINQSFADRLETHEYNFPNTTAYLYYRFNVTQNNGANIVQVAELQLSNGDDTPPPVSDMKSAIGKGPGSSWNAKLTGGFTGVGALRFSGSVLATGRGYSYNKVIEVDIPVVATTELSYMLFIDETANDFNYPSGYAAVDLAFDDGTYLSKLGAVDQHFAKLDPQAQGASRTLYPGEWNRKVSNIGAVATGKTIKRILVGYDNPKGPAASFGGWIDDLRIVAHPTATAVTHLSDYAITTRGTNSGGGYSRGNNFPATAVPHGFNFWTPVTDAGSDSWLYSYHRDNNAQNLPQLQALALSHEPSPWMGDRQGFQFMPSTAAGMPNAGRTQRALAFKHSSETARPYYYGVRFENGVQAEIAPTDHAAMFRFTYPGNDANVIFDQMNNNGRVTLDAGNQSITGYSDARSGLSAGATRIFVYATFDKPVTNSGMLSGGGGANVTGYFKLGVSAADRVVTMRVATSLISVDQAKKNLELEIAANDTFEAVRDRAQAAWDAKLGVIEVEGANLDQKTTLYSNLYRLFLYPNSGFENTGTAAAPVYKYASPVSPLTGTNTPTQTGAKVVNGKIYVNNGFWDTYRATWPAYALFSPKEAGEMIDGFVQQYRDGGWISRWSSPGYADLMTGTSSDVAFADAYVKGVTNFDAVSAYDAALRNATVVPPSGAVGRKGMARAPFLGWTSRDDEGAGFSWSMAGYLNDFGLANLADALAADAGDPRHQEYVEAAEFFRSRSLGYARLYDPATKFFQGRNDAGAFTFGPGNYDPRRWGDDYTETNGWNMAFDAPHDGLGLANLYGGKAQLAAKLDTFFTTPELGNDGGGYGGIIHEMREARDVRMGQLGMSNQPAFHIVYMYNYAGQPFRTQEKVRDALARLFVGSEIGQGYIGDEDNGATSSWYLFSALGFYPLQVGSSTYVIGSPLFTKATVHLQNGKTIVINAPANSAKNVYVQSLKVNGAAYGKTYLSHATLAAGATLDFVMGPAPSAWGTGDADAPPSITTSGTPKPLKDLALASAGTVTTSDGTNAAGLFDDTSDTRVSFGGANASVTYKFTSGTPTVTFYTLTSGTGATDPTGWKLLGSTDGTNFVTLDERSAQTFTWRLQTRPFKVANPGAYSSYRIELTGPGGTSLAEVELLAK